MAQHITHLPILAERVGVNVVDAAGAKPLDERRQQARADAVPLPAIGHDERQLSLPVGRHRRECFPDDATLGVFRHDRVPAGGEHLVPQFVDCALGSDTRHEAQVQRVRRESSPQVADPRNIAGTCRPNPHCRHDVAIHRVKDRPRGRRTPEHLRPFSGPFIHRIFTVGSRRAAKNGP